MSNFCEISTNMILILKNALEYVIHKMAAIFNRPHFADDIFRCIFAKILGSSLIRYWSDVKKSDRCLIDVYPMLLMCGSGDVYSLISSFRRSVIDRFHKQRAGNPKILCFLVLKRLLNRQSSYRWFQTQWRSCDVTVMKPAFHSLKTKELS